MELAIEAFEHGVYDFFTKPADLQRLKRACRRALDYNEIHRQQKTSQRRSSEEKPRTSRSK